jgi:TonB-linked SusC/RagA family outer membrane protein
VVLAGGALWAQNVQVSGVVTDAADGQPLPGVSVVVKGARISTSTDVNGRYTISVSDDATLVFSYVGLQTQEQTVGGRSTINVALETATTQLKDVVVVAYGTQKRSTIVGAVKSVDGEQLAAISTSNVTNALQGTVAGVQVVNGSGQPGTGAVIRIRGVGSISGGTTPLYIVDGAPYDESGLNLLNPHDIESMTILKDASATAIYGARGANGVVLITTKGGDRTGKIQVNVEAKWGNSSRGVPNYDVMTDPALYYETAYKALYNSQAYIGKSAGDAYAYADSKFLTQDGVGYQIYTVPDGQRLIGTNFKLNPNATLGYSDGDFFYTPDNWEKETLKANNLRKEYNVSVQGGAKELQFFVSAGHLNDPGIVNGSGFERYTLRAKVDSKAKKWLKFGASAVYVNATLQDPGYQDSWGSTGNVFYTANMMAPIYPFYVRNADQSQKIDDRGYQVYDAGTSTNFIRPGGAPRSNYAINLLLDNNSAVTDHFSGNVYLTVTPLEGLSLTARISPDATNVRSNFLSNPFYGSPATQGYVSVQHERMFILNQQYLADYKKTFADIHTIEVLAGYESFSLTDQVLSANNDHLYSPFIGELGNAFGTQPVSAQATSYADHFATAGYFGRVQYDLLDRYFFNATARYEGSSRFAPDKRWGAFGSIGAGWLISQEAFLDGTKDWLDELKYKISYGTQGNDQLTNYYVYRDLYNIAYNSDTGEYTKVLSQKGNPDLTWEAQKLFNTGVEFSIFNGKLSGSIDYFSRVNSDMLFNVPMPPSAGYSTEPQNIGSVSNTGFEFDFSSKVFETKDIAWTLFANLTTINSKILKLPDTYKPTDADPIGGIKGSTYIYREGGSLNQLYIQQYAGVDPATGEALYYKDPAKGDYSTTANYTAAKQTDLGDVSVKCYGGFGTTFEAYGFDLNAQFAYQLGGKAYDGSYQELMHTGKQTGRNWHMDILNAWTPENTNTDVPRIDAADDHDQKPSDRWLVSTNYLSLNNLTLGYTVPAKFTKKIQVNKLRVYVSGDNLALFSARKGYDPRQYQNASRTGVALSTSSGNFVYSALKVVSMGISITF